MSRKLAVSETLMEKNNKRSILDLVLGIDGIVDRVAKC